jgi:hypothetical protein
MGAPLTPLLSNPLFELGTTEGTDWITLDFCIHTLINRLDHSVQKIHGWLMGNHPLNQQISELSKMADNTKKYNPLLLRLTSTTSNSISQTTSSHKSSCNQKRTPKTNAESTINHKTPCSKKRRLKTNAQKNKQGVTKAKT